MRAVKNLIFVLFIVFAGISTCYSQTSKDHPFLLTSKDRYAELIAKQDTFPWSTIKKNAESALNKSYTSTTNLTWNCVNIQNLVAANALLYILDPDNKETYILNSEAILDTLDTDTDLLLGNDQSSDQAKAIGSCYFICLIAMDIMYDDLDSVKRTSYEAIISERIFKINISSWKLNAYGILGTWELYSQSKLIYALRWYPEFLIQTSPDGVGYNGSSYPAARLNYDRWAKAYFLDVLDFTGTKKTYTDARMIKFYEWLYGYSISPFRRSYTFGDSGSDRWYRKDVGFRAGRFSDLAKGYASWAYQSEEPTGTLLSYLTITEPPGDPVIPRSRIFPDGGAWFLEGSGSKNDLAGAMWNIKGTDWHAHKDVNALHLCAYGEHVLRNSGYAAKIDQDLLGFSWDYRYNDSRSGNTATINGKSHFRKYGGGISEGFTGDVVDYAKGLSNKPGSYTLQDNGSHIRYFQFIHPQGSLPGYWVVFDELEGGPGGTGNVYWHPNASNCNPHTEKTEYTSNIYPVTWGTNTVHLSIFLGTPPDSVTLKDGVLANMNSGASFVGRYIDAQYNLDVAGKAKIVTVLFPHDQEHAKSVMERFDGSGYTGVSIKQSDAITDYAVASSGEEETNAGIFSFTGDNAIVRMNQGIPAFYFATGSSSFRTGDYGFKSESKISLYATQAEGSIITPVIQELTFYNPGIQKLYIDMQEIPVKVSGEGWISVDIPQGTHQFTFNTPFVSVLDKTKLSGNITVTLYPNPARNYVVINMEADRTSKGSVMVYNILGQCIWVEDLPCDSGNEMRLDISEWSSGTYLVQINLGQKVVYKKLVVTK